MGLDGLELYKDGINVSRGIGDWTGHVIECIVDARLERKIWKEIKWGEGVPNFKWVFYKDRHNYKKMWSYTKKKIINHF